MNQVQCDPSQVPQQSSSPSSDGILPQQGGIDEMLGSLDLDLGVQSPRRTPDEGENLEEDKLFNFDSVL